MNMTKECAEIICTEFNKAHPVGRKVILVMDLGETKETEIRAPAEMSVNGPVVWLRDVTGSYKLDRVITVLSDDM